MGLILNGNAPNKILYNGAEVSLYFNGSKIWPNAAPALDEVTIGTQTWKSKNLAIDDGQGGIYTHTVNYGQGNVVEYYYTWDAAVRVAASIPGWHLPTRSEWDTLITAAGGASTGCIKLKSTYGWYDGGEGTDDYGFAVFPAGYSRNGTLSTWGNYGYFWTVEAFSTGRAYYRRFNGEGDITSGNLLKTDSISVRLIKDS